MNKEEFISGLKNALSGLPQDDIEERIAFYAEMIDDRIEEGMNEADAVAGIGSINDIVDRTISEVPITKLVKERIKPAHTLRVWEIVLIILGFPLWFSLLIAAGAVALSLYFVVWALLISVWAVEASLLACAIGGIVLTGIYFFQGYGLQGAILFGITLFCAGLSIFLLFGCIAASKGIFWLSKKLVFGIKSMFVGKENVN